MDDKIFLPKLTLSNYVQWAKVLEHFIRSKWLWGLFDGSKNEPQLISIETTIRKSHELKETKKDKIYKKNGKNGRYDIIKSLF